MAIVYRDGLTSCEPDWLRLRIAARSEGAYVC